METPPKTAPDHWSLLLSNTPNLTRRLPPVFFIPLLFWGLVNIIQSIWTEIGDDEAYYWMYSKHLDWGYFDHPPMIALFIKAGTLLFNKELGVRLVTILAQLITLILLWLLINDKTSDFKRILLFFGISASIVMFQVYGFMATPDSPLLLFTAFFLLSYRRFLEKESLINIALLVLAMAGLIYSKYHGALIIFFVLLSNPRLLWKRNFWIAGVIALVFLIPHILWQFENNFASIQFHLVTRSRSFQLLPVLQYWPNQLLSFNPFFFGLILFLLFRYKPRDLFDRAIYFIAGGFLILFFISSFRGHVEPHWTISICIGMIVIVYRKCIEHESIRKYVTRVMIPSVVLLIFLRLGLLIDFLPLNVSDKIHGRKETNEYLSSLAGNAPVIFYNSYQKPSVYTFYTGKPSTTLNGFHNRNSQYDLWQLEQSFLGKPAVIFTDGLDNIGTPFQLPNGRTNYIYRTDHFFTVQRLEISFPAGLPATMQVGDSISLEIELYNPNSSPVSFANSEYPVFFEPIFFKTKKLRPHTLAKVTPVFLSMSPFEKKKLRLQFEVPEIWPDQYQFGIALKAGILHESRNSPLVPVEVHSSIMK